MSRGPLLLLLLALVLGMPGPTPTGGATDGPDRDEWVEKLTEARNELQQARLRYAQSMQSYRQMRHRRRLRGDAKQAVLDERDAAEEAVARAERRMDRTLRDARRAGVPPGWIREGMQDGAGAANYE